MFFKKSSTRGFTLIEMVVVLMLSGAILLAFSGIFMLFQKNASKTHQYTDAQQNARVAIDYLTEHLRHAGTGTDYVRGQRFIVHAAPYQVAFNADMDNGQTIAGDAPLLTLDRAFSPNKVPAAGTTIYAPPRDFDSPAETVVLTLDSNNDGAISSLDHGDDLAEDGPNANLYLLKKQTYGSDGTTTNEVRTSSLALVRGPGTYPDGSEPEPLFQYYFDHDADVAAECYALGQLMGCHCCCQSRRLAVFSVRGGLWARSIASHRRCAPHVVWPLPRT